MFRGMRSHLHARPSAPLTTLFSHVWSVALQIIDPVAEVDYNKISNPIDYLIELSKLKTSPLHPDIDVQAFAIGPFSEEEWKQGIPIDKLKSHFAALQAVLGLFVQITGHIFAEIGYKDRENCFRVYLYILACVNNLKQVGIPDSVLDPKLWQPEVNLLHQTMVVAECSTISTCAYLDAALSKLNRSIPAVDPNTKLGNMVARDLFKLIDTITKRSNEDTLDEMTTSQVIRHFRLLSLFDLIRVQLASDMKALHQTAIAVTAVANGRPVRPSPGSQNMSTLEVLPKNYVQKPQLYNFHTVAGQRRWKRLQLVFRSRDDGFSQAGGFADKPMPKK